MVYPALHNLLLLFLLVVGALSPDAASVSYPVVAITIVAGTIVHRQRLPRVRRTAIRALSSAWRVLQIASGVVAFVIALGDTSANASVRFSALLALATGVLLFRAWAHTAGLLRDPALALESRTVTGELLALVIIIYPDQPLTLAAGSVLLLAAALRWLVPIEKNSLSVSQVVRSTLINLLTVTIAVGMSTGFERRVFLSLPAAALLLLATISLGAWVASVTRFARRYGLSGGMMRSLFTYYGVPFRLRMLKRMYQRFVGSGSLVFDVGAHVGNRVVAFRALGARVVAVEPQPAFAELLRRLFAADELVSVLELCLGPEPGTVSLQISSSHPTLSTASATWGQTLQKLDPESRIAWDTTIERQQRTLDELRRQYGEPDFVKIDVEGFEASVLQGLTSAVPAVSVEFMPGAVDGTRASVNQLERNARYRYNYSFGESMRFHRAHAVAAESLLTEMSALPPGSPSGDIYAVLDQPSGNHG